MKPAIKIASMVGIPGILAGVAYWDEWQTEKDKESKEKENRIFGSLTGKDDVFESEDRRDVRKLVKEDGKWLCRSHAVQRIKRLLIILLSRSLISSRKAVG